MTAQSRCHFFTSLLLVLLLLPDLGLAEGLSDGVPLTVSVSRADGLPLADVVVSLHSETLPAVARNNKAIMDQQDRQFFPRVVPLQAGTEVHFPNRDDVRHHVYSFSRPNDFEIQLYHGETAQPHTFDHPGIVVIGCNIHDGMLGYLRVLDTPLFGKSDESGIVVLSDVPKGDYALQAWHPDLGERVVILPVSVKSINEPLSVKLDPLPDGALKAKPSNSHSLQSLFRDY